MTRFLGLLLVFVVATPTWSREEAAAVRVRVALALAAAQVSSRPGPGPVEEHETHAARTARLQEDYQRAFLEATQRQRPLLVFVNIRPLTVTGCVTVAQEAFPGRDSPGVVVGMPDPDHRDQLLRIADCEGPTTAMRLLALIRAWQIQQNLEVSYSQALTITPPPPPVTTFPWVHGGIAVGGGFRFRGGVTNCGPSG